ncbi:MAG: hypothetical protein IPG56_04715 [Caulobacteraceae bacterium]|nr:hypothetical protein [Caulobacteraceae bacterium]
MPISIPDIDPRREVARRVFDAFVSQVPIFGGPAVAVWSVTHPSEAEQKWQAWAGDVANAINKMEEVVSALVPTVRLSEERPRSAFGSARIQRRAVPNQLGLIVWSRRFQAQQTRVAGRVWRTGDAGIGEDVGSNWPSRSHHIAPR